MDRGKLTIIHIVESFSGGVFDFISDIVNELPEYDHVIIHGLREDTPHNYTQLIKASEFIEVKNFQREINLIKDFKALIEVISILRRFKTRKIVIHLHSSKAGFIGRIASRFLKLHNKVVYTPHGASFLRKDITSLKRNIYILCEKIAARCGGFVVACSKSEAEEFKKYKINAFYINNGVKNYSKIFMDETKSFNKEKIIVGNSGRIVEPKNPDLFNSIAKEFIGVKEIEFLWIGDGPLKDRLNSPNIRITGWLSRDKAIEYLANDVDIYLSTSLWEGLSLTILQAMSLKKPLVLYKCVGNIDLVSRDQNGFLFTTKDEAVKALKILINDENMRKRFGENSYSLYINEFNDKKMLSQYKKLYKELGGMAT
jgi:glycosyltransferase involved in cell wall biosynthesis